MRILPFLLLFSLAHADELVLLEDGKGHAIALDPKDQKSRLYYSYGKGWVEVPVDPAENTGPMPNGDLTRHFLDPRFPSRKKITNWQEMEKAQTRVVHEGPRWFVQCGPRKTPLTAGKQTVALKSEPPSGRRAHALARDDRGRYYYVDVDAGGANHRIFVGEKGNLKRLKMVNVVADSEGEIYTTPQGKLRLVLNKDESTWVEEGGKKKLTRVPIDENQPLVYVELGLYAGERFGTPCDDL
jgi:hypothetical protein